MKCDLGVSLYSRLKHQKDSRNIQLKADPPSLLLLRLPILEYWLLEIEEIGTKKAVTLTYRALQNQGLLSNLGPLPGLASYAGSVFS